MGITATLSSKLHQLPHPPASWLFKPVKVLPWEIRNKPLELACNRVFAQPLADGEFDLLEERWLKIEVSDLDLEFYISVSDEKLIMGNPRPCDVMIKGQSKDYLTLIARKEDPDTLFFNRRLMIEGDTELGLGIKNLLDGIDLDQLPELMRWVIRRM